MPHLVMLYTPQLDAACDIDQLCRGLADAMLSVRDEAGAQVFPTGGTRVLAYRSDHHAISDGSGDHTEVDEGPEVFDAKLGNLHPLFAKK